MDARLLHQVLRKHQIERWQGESCVVCDFNRGAAGAEQNEWAERAIL